MSKDHYATLGVGKSATPEEIKAAFRKLAHQYHPDKPTGDVEKFKEINAAYQVLSDPAKRSQYDQYGSTFDNAGPGQGFGGQGFGAGFQGFDMNDLGDIFGDAFGFGGGRSRRAPHGRDIQIDAEISFEESIFGVDREIQLTKTSACERCGGVGAEPGTGSETCKDCSGRGTQRTAQRTILGTFQTETTCRRCDGRGEIPKTACTSCRGSGVEHGKKTLTFTIPQGVEEGTMLRLRGEGEAVKGGEAGNLFVRIHVRPDKRFTREGQTIFSKANIGFSQAALGDTIEVETVDGKADLKIPSGTQPGTEFRLKGKGVPHGRSRGDHIVVVSVVTPKDLSKAQKKLLEELDLKE